MQNRSVKDPFNICASHESKVKRDEKRVGLSPPHTSGADRLHGKYQALRYSKVTRQPHSQPSFSPFT